METTKTDHTFAEIADRLSAWHDAERGEWLTRLATLTRLVDELCVQQRDGLSHERLQAGRMLWALETGIQFKIDCLDGTMARRFRGELGDD